MPTLKRVLLLACSQRKTSAAEPVRAWDLYDGQAYRVLRALERAGGFPAEVDVFILSAKHGLVHRDDKLEPYNEKLTRERAEELRGPVWDRLRAELGAGPPRDVFLQGGKLYLDVLEPRRLQTLPGVGAVAFAGGGLGEQVSQAKAWVRGRGRYAAATT